MDSAIAEKLLEVFEDYKIEIDKLGFYEPINILFTKEKFIEMWMTGLDNSFLFYSSLKKSKDYISVNPKVGIPGSAYFLIRLSKTNFCKRKTFWIDLFETICEDFMPYRAYISKEIVERHAYEYEHNEYIFLKPEEVEWLNYWSKELLSLAKINRINSFDWISVKTTLHGKYYKLTDDIQDDSYFIRAEQAREKFGEEILLQRDFDPDFLLDLEYQAKMNSLDSKK